MTIYAAGGIYDRVGVMMLRHGVGHFLSMFKTDL